MRAREARRGAAPLLSLLLVLPLASTGLRAAPPGAAAIGEALVDDLARGRLDAVVARFDQRMKAALPKEKLGAVWQQVESQAGRFRSRGRAKVEGTGVPAVAVVRCSFEKLDLLARVTVDAEGRVAGLFFAPAPPEAAWKAPAYVRPGSFSEKELTAGAPGWPLPATLSLPAGAGPFPGLVLVHGSGPQDRDESVGGSRPFRDLAQGLASRGIAVLRYEKRTQAHGARLAKEKGSITVVEEVVDDAVAAARLLRRTAGVDPARVFLLGHSLGGTLGPDIALRDAALAGLVIAAGATRPVDELILEQTAYILEMSGAPREEREKKLAELRAQTARLRDPKSDGAVLGAPASYWRSVLALRPVESVKRLSIPVLVLQGGRDYQVTAKDLAGWQAALAGRTTATLKTYPRANHLFIEGDGPSLPAEYERPGHVAETVVADVASWLLAVRPNRS